MLTRIGLIPPRMALLSRNRILWPGVKKWDCDAHFLIPSPLLVILPASWQPAERIGRSGDT